jgi:hypothetical protein
MIQYPITLADLVARIDALVPSWRKRAYQRTQDYIAANDYTGGNEFWGEIKSIYIDLQYEKCAYCETKLQGSQLAKKVHEVEHYRPKQSVAAWPNRNVPHWQHFNPTWAVGKESNRGYYKLAYHPLNYAIACTRCNSTLKSNYFPVGGRRNIRGSDPTTLAKELPLLIYPLSTVDADDPSDIITFDGVIAVPVHDSGPLFERAVTNIEFFQLNHEDLTSRRAEDLLKLWLALENTTKLPPSRDRERAERILSRMLSPSYQFSSCMLAFETLYYGDYAAAEKIIDPIADGISP